MTADLPPAIICDLDGTLALLNRRDPYDASTCMDDALNESVAHIVQTYAAAGVAVIVVSGRNVRHRKETEQWLAAHSIERAHLYMRGPRDFRKDAVLKAELFERKIREQYQVLFVLEVRVRR
jgi:phosphoglycolate phosphatase-like HAD superfamily hydrolase